jgi:multicomponent Na+:H+ antiporter subunit F
MNSGFLDAAIMIALFALVVSGACAIARLLRGPSLLDRVVALDVLAVLVVGMIAVAAIRTDQPALIDVALALALVAFLGTVAFARFLEERNQSD